MQSYELCCDMIDVVIDISCIYGWVTFTCTYENRQHDLIKTVQFFAERGKA